MPVQIGSATGRVIVVARAAIQTGMHHADIERLGLRRRIAGQQAFCNMGVAKAQSMDRDGMAVDLQLDRLGTATENQGIFRRLKLPGLARQRIMVAPDDVATDPGPLQAQQFAL